MKKIKYCFVVLEYNGYNDFKNFYESIQMNSDDFKLILVDSFSSENLKKEGKLLSKKLNIDFISVPNRGYGAGNNAGIKFATDNYNFEYLIIANPDTVIKKLEYKVLSEHGLDKIIGPEITNLNGKKQNPLYFKKYKLPFFVLEKYSISGSIATLYIYLVLNKIYSKYNQFLNRKEKILNVYALHGSFFAIGREALLKLQPVFDEKMFLFIEEDHVAEKSRMLSIPLVLDRRLNVCHKENGSTGESGLSPSSRKIALESLRAFFSNTY
ncbi:glycosyltransferase [Oenococcus oeni]|uniref:glycosyltransferase n=1 Tax=Oenococcus oeni TaxID=1247 RepID=UPI00050DCEC7|nr:glycosyltransferase [Oenococcus oeni]KGH87910.1 hypothetical protein X350_06365 [Oenococcus oeni S12]